MLHYDRIDVSEGNDINKTSESKECMLFHYWYFKDIGYKFHDYSISRISRLENSTNLSNQLT